MIVLRHVDMLFFASGEHDLFVSGGHDFLLQEMNIFFVSGGHDLFVSGGHNFCIR